MVFRRRDKSPERVLQPRTHYVGADGQSISAEDMKYSADCIILLTEDQPEILQQMIGSVQRAQRTLRGRLGEPEYITQVCATSSVPEVVDNLGRFMTYSPTAKLYACLDFNMGHNTQSGSRRPTEGLWYDSTFQHFLQNGGAVIMYTGFPEAVQQSEVIMKTKENYPNVEAVGIAQKSNPQLPLDRVILGLTMRAMYPSKAGKR